MEAQRPDKGGPVRIGGDAPPPLPQSIRNCYWVVHGRLLAGMHPWSESRTSTLERLRELKSLGIDWIEDLTFADESAGYAVEYPGLLANFGVEHRRFGLPDHGIPTDDGVVSAALDALDGALDSGRKVYLHCRAGIGRTGLVVGCWLARHGHRGEEALTQLNELWTSSRLSATWSRIPETDQQARYVREWRERLAKPAGRAVVDAVEPALRAPTAAERCAGAMLGMAVAEACALDPSLLADRGSASLAWSGHTAMTVCLAESLLACGRNDPEDQMRRYLEWQRHGRPSSTGVATGVPDDLKRALAHWQWTHKPVAGSHDPARSDPHTLPRSVAVALYLRAWPAVAIEQAAEASRTSQQSPVVLDACRVVAALTLDAIGGVDRGALVDCAGPVSRALARERLKPPIERLMAGDWRRVSPERARMRATVRGVLATTLRTIESTSRFADGVRSLVGNRADPTAAALYGALTGAQSGITALPPNWVERLRQRTLLEDVASRLCEAGRPR